MIDRLQTYADLSKVFRQHLTAIDNDISLIELKSLWQDIVSRYSEPLRAYHTLAHLQHLFAEFEQIKDKLQQPSIIALALFYHDVIYHPQRDDNELKSAEYAVKVLSPYLSTEQLRGVYDLIIMTADHQIKDKTNLGAAYLLDMDLSILGAPWPEYARYAKAVRQEYAHVTQADYRLGRTKVLAQLLARPRLYLTDYYQRLEAQARDNVEREITSLAV